MAKTYNTFTNVATGDPLPATTFNNLLTNVANYRVPPMCELTRAATQSINNATDTLVQFDTVTYDTGASESPADAIGATGASARLNIKTTGLYIVSCGASFAANTTGIRNISVWRGGSTSDRVIDVQGYVTSVSSSNTVTATRLVSLAAGTYIDLRVYQTSGGALNLQAQTWLGVAWAGQVS